MLMYIGHNIPTDIASTKITRFDDGEERTHVNTWQTLMQMGLRAPWVLEKEDGMPEYRMRRKQYT
jgi:hypothetical protein